MVFIIQLLGLSPPVRGNSAWFVYSLQAFGAIPACTGELYDKPQVMVSSRVASACMGDPDVGVVPEVLFSLLGGVDVPG